MTQDLLREDDLVRRLKLLNEIGAALSSKRDVQELMELILLRAKELTHADGGSLYSVTDHGTLAFEIVRTDSLGLGWGGRGQEPVPFPEIPLYDTSGRPNEQMVVCYAALNKQTVNIQDAYNVDGFNFSGTRQFDTKTGYRSKSFLTVPMIDHDGDVVGILQLLNSIDPTTQEIASFSQEDQQLVESLASQATVAWENNKLISDLNAMIEGFIESIAGAIDEQSRFTGNHCRRVPVIAKFIAEAVNTTRLEPFDGFELTPTELYELHMAALLHDCGKVSTPIHILDKSTRLETVVDKIELIDTRYAVLKRDAEIRYLKLQLEAAGGPPEEDSDHLQEQYKKELQDLDHERHFLKDSNNPSVFMSDDRQEQAKEIAKRTWEDADGFELPLLNEGELDNMCIARGTLNPEERKIIEYHATATIKMLSNLPYPNHLKQVPEIAGRHHEWMNGQGYPNGITGDMMSVQARILAIADVFEALTAPDRPYKAPMKLSKANGILKHLVEIGHLDPDLVSVFMEQRVGHRYAVEYLRPEQHDLE